ncbi:hypothetical protein F5876DRAFT_63983 [Lentinula aff. lateritia]|uniref:Uncharacterized protein n=1 Tax=Lentinula aff. lateritia TaxID=2804960 RepID=A0ACC1U6L6_9AGAR|nr:hypothetical protein F5876DRAFT_63983 [Lentinula aff. lateritia]
MNDAYWMNAEAFLPTVDEMAIPVLDVRYNKGEMELSWSQRVYSGDGDGGRKEGSQAAFVVLYAKKHCGIVAYGSKPLTWSKVPRSSRWTSTHRSLLTSRGPRWSKKEGRESAKNQNIKHLVREYSVKISQMKKFGFPGMGGHHPKWWDAEEQRTWIWQPYLETELSLEDILGKYVFVAMHDEDDYNLQMTLSNPGHITLSAPQNTLLSWDTVEGTYERAQLTGSFTGVHPPGPSRLTPAELALTRPNLRRFDFHTMVPPNWYLGKVNHAIDVVTPMDSNGNHYISVMLHYFDNPREDGVWYLGKKVVGGVDGERGLTEDERVKLGIGSHLLKPSTIYQQQVAYGRVSLNTFSRATDLIP